VRGALPGAALHYADGRNGVKDFDVWTFFAAHPARPCPSRRRKVLDFGPSKFGRSPGAPARFTGRRVDMLGRSLPEPPDADPIEAIRHYLRARRTPTAKLLGEKAVVLISPQGQRGTVAWVAGRERSSFVPTRRSGGPRDQQKRR
jgi:hypothetical protein